MYKQFCKCLELLNVPSLLRRNSRFFSGEEGLLSNVSASTSLPVRLHKHCTADLHNESLNLCGSLCGGQRNVPVLEKRFLLDIRSPCTSCISTQQRHSKGCLQSKTAYKMGSTHTVQLIFCRVALKLYTMRILHHDPKQCFPLLRLVSISMTRRVYYYLAIECKCTFSFSASPLLPISSPFTGVIWVRTPIFQVRYFLDRFIFSRLKS